MFFFSSITFLRKGFPQLQIERRSELIILSKLQKKKNDRIKDFEIRKQKKKKIKAER